MATMNPLEQKARSSFIKGFIIALLIGIIASGGLGYKIYFMQKAEKERLAKLVTVYALKTDVKSGESMINSTSSNNGKTTDVITSDMFTKITIDRACVPADATNMSDYISNFYLTDSNGVQLEACEAVDENNEPTGELFAGYKDPEDGVPHEVMKETTDKGNKYYYTKEVEGQLVRVDLELTQQPYIAKIDLKKNTIVTPSMFTASDERITADMRTIEFSMISLPYDLEDGDTIAVCISGGKDSFLMAKCFQELKKHNKIEFDLVFLCMNPGYNEKNHQLILDNAKLLNIPIEVFDTDIFERVTNIPDHPCYLCARMRRGYLYEKAKEHGCNKIALGHHFNDVIETILMGMLYGAQTQTMMPKVKSTSHPGMQLIRPMYLIKEDDVIRWRERNELKFLQCACKFTEENYKYDNDPGESKRKRVKLLIKELKEEYENIDINIFRSVENVNLDTLISYFKKDEHHHFLDDFNE